MKGERRCIHGCNAENCMAQAQRSVAIELRNITKTFGSIVANKNVSLSVYRGEILSLLGENGSGKTTLMNMLSGIYFRTPAKY